MCLGQKCKIHVFVEMFQTHFALKSDKREKNIFILSCCCICFHVQSNNTFFSYGLPIVPVFVCTNLWGLKVGAPPVADAVINHPVLFHTILPSKDLAHKQMLMNS